MTAAPLMTARRSIVFGLTAMFAVGCTAVGPDYQRPELQLPASWHSERAAGLAADTVDDQAWWQQFGDEVLTDLVTRALHQNLDLRQSLTRLAGARAQLGIANSGHWLTVDGNADYTYRNASRNTPFGAFIPRTNVHTATFDAAWELDLWGRVRRSVEAADADLAANEFDVQDAALVVAAEVARTYIDLRAAQRRLAIAHDNLDLQQQTLKLVQSRLSAGLVAELDVAQAATNVETTRSRMPQLEATAATARNRLAVLLGVTPDRLPDALLASTKLPQLPASIAVGVPADLLRRRPDVRRAERLLAVEVARIGVTEAERYPILSLSGQIGLSANSAKKFFDANSDVSSFGPSLRWNLFDGGRLKHRILALEANAEAAQIAYEQSVLLALEEVENAMTLFAHERIRHRSLTRAVERARRTVELAQSQYREGLRDFQAVLDSQRVAATIDDDLVNSDAALATNLIALFKALGGGMPNRGDHAE